MGPVKQDILPPKLYSVTVTDEKNKEQVEQTRNWLETLVKDKSKMKATKILPCAPDPEPPWDESEQFVHDPDVWYEKLAAYEMTFGWFDVLLEAAGYEEVLEKKKWIASIGDRSQYRAVEC